MKLDDLRKLYTRDLNKLRAEVEAFQNEDNLWKVTGKLPNSSGNLMLHLTGNLNHFFGAIILNNAYKRDREFEFGGKKSKEEILVEIEATIEVIDHTFSTISNEILDEKYPLEVFGEPMSYFEFILHLYGHLNWHLGQINYLRRILEA